MTSDKPMNEKVVLITGSTRGIGKETALALAALGATTVIVGRDPTRTAETADEIRRQTGSQAHQQVFLHFTSPAR
mgnify:CR=1 FL=1